MNCRRSQEYLSAYIDGELDAATSASLSEHLTRCETCSDELVALRQMLGSMVRAAPSMRCPDGIWQTLNQRMVQAPAPIVAPRRGPAIAPVWSIAVAAAVCCTVLTPQSASRLSFMRAPAEQAGSASQGSPASTAPAFAPLTAEMVKAALETPALAPVNAAPTAPAPTAATVAPPPRTPVSTSARVTRIDPEVAVPVATRPAAEPTEVAVQPDAPTVSATNNRLAAPRGQAARLGHPGSVRLAFHVPVLESAAVPRFASAASGARVLAPATVEMPDSSSTGIAPDNLQGTGGRLTPVSVHPAPDTGASSDTPSDPAADDNAASIYESANRDSASIEQASKDLVGMALEANDGASAVDSAGTASGV